MRIRIAPKYFAAIFEWAAVAFVHIGAEYVAIL
jgi:hypothetical protein